MNFAKFNHSSVRPYEEFSVILCKYFDVSGSKKFNYVMASFPESLWAEIREEFGEHCLRRGDYKKANENFRESLQHEENKLDSVYRLTNSQAREANLDSALELLKEKSRLGEASHAIKGSSAYSDFHLQPISRITSTAICRSATATTRRICLRRVFC